MGGGEGRGEGVLMVCFRFFFETVLDVTSTQQGQAGAVLWIGFSGSRSVFGRA